MVSRLVGWLVGRYSVGGLVGCSVSWLVPCSVTWLVGQLLGRYAVVDIRYVGREAGRQAGR